MKDLLAQANAEVLKEAMSHDPLVVFDFDGTLAPITETPDHAQMRVNTRALLDRLSRILPCCILSGRALADVSSRVQGIPLSFIVGNHGAQWTEHMDDAVRKQVQQWHEMLQNALQMHRVIIENKGCSLSIHVRSTDAVPLIEEALSQLPNSRVIGGKRVYNVVARDAFHKGDAIEKLLAHSGRPFSIYAGDDETDEDVFDLTGKLPLLGIRIGKSEKSRAEYYVEDQTSIDSLLHMMIESKRRRPAAGSD